MLQLKAENIQLLKKMEEFEKKSSSWELKQRLARNEFLRRQVRLGHKPCPGTAEAKGVSLLVCRRSRGGGSRRR
jgi:hypothetical protein